MQNLHLGTIGWSYNFWKGSFYPQKTPSKDFLTYYTTRFNTVEVDSTFYRIPTQQAVTNWKNQTTPNFKFSLKFPSAITHIKMLRDCERETSFFLERTKLLSEKLGAMLLQFPPNFLVNRLPDLAAFLHKLPKTNRYVVEVRNKAWLNADFYSVLRNNNAALAWVDSPNMPLTMEVTSDFLYVRLEGNRKKVNGTLGKIEADTQTSLQVWAERLKPFVVGKREVFGYFGKYFSGFPPSDVDFLSKLLTQST
ncbi:MAG: DUF72 domain-containing protein [Candidatus Bathyarchaeia archaeon]|jgi:uncharacterized protein YecE (DUF72 family)